MRAHLVAIIGFVLCASAGTARAQYAQVQVSFATPPPLVVVEPGIQVVPDFEEEVFFVDGWYWHRGPRAVWYRTRDYRGGWVACEPHVVPARLVRLPPGHYKRWKVEKFHGRGHGGRVRVAETRRGTVVRVKEKHHRH